MLPVVNRLHSSQDMRICSPIPSPTDGCLGQFSPQLIVVCNAWLSGRVLPGRSRALIKLLRKVKSKQEEFSLLELFGLSVTPSFATSNT